ncbi:MAG: biopolymer transporter ExbD [Planctomycetes bacterium]|nr:biopolymer transporter ExbD [Planctomycetota bacterium]
MKKRQSRIVFNNTSMLDVIFIILIFFISISRLQEGWLDIRLPESEDDRQGARPSSGETLVISIDAEDRLMANRRALRNEQELAAVAREYASTGGAEAPVRFVADRASRSGTLVTTLKTVSDAGLRNISFGYEPKKEKR